MVTNMKFKRYSKQREAIYRALQERRDHPTAETLYLSLKQAQPTLSLATVYRNLNQLEHSGHILRLSFDVDRYDGNVAPHPHFFCTCCRNLADLNLPINDTLDEMVSKMGYHVARHDLIFRGTCFSCAKRESAQTDVCGSSRLP